MRLVIFDFDGVIADTLSLYIEANKEILLKFGINTGRNEIKKLLGGSAADFYANFLDRKYIDEAVEALSQLVITERYQRKVRLIPGVIDLLKDISATNVKMAIVTNSDSLFVYRVLERFQLTSFFAQILCGDIPLDKVGRSKRIMSSLGIGKKEVMFVGDLLSDIEVSRRLGCRSCLVYNRYSWLYPESAVADNCNADYVIDDIRKLKNIL